MTCSDVLTGYKPLGVSHLGPLFLWNNLRFGSCYVAEAESNRPAHFARLMRLLTRKGRSREDAEDLIQEALLRPHIYTKDEAVLSEEAFLCKTIHNLVIDRYRHARSGLRCEVPIEDIDRQSPLVAPGPTPDQILDDQQRLDALTARLDATNPRTREIYMAHRSGYTYAEIAHHMGIAEITVQRHIARAQASLTKADL